MSKGEWSSFHSPSLLKFRSCPTWAVIVAAILVTFPLPGFPGGITLSRSRVFLLATCPDRACGHIPRARPRLGPAALAAFHLLNH